MKYKHIEASREARLWITTIVMVAMIPGVRETVGNAFTSARKTIKNKFRRN